MCFSSWLANTLDSPHTLAPLLFRKRGAHQDSSGLLGITAGLQLHVRRLPLPAGQAVRRGLRHGRQGHPVRPPRRHLQVLAHVEGQGRSARAASKRIVQFKLFCGWQGAELAVFQISSWLICRLFFCFFVVLFYLVVPFDGYKHHVVLSPAGHHRVRAAH